MPAPSSWLTAPRVRRLEIVLAALPDRSPALDENDAALRIWRRAGGPIEEIQRLIEVLIHAELVRHDGGTLRVTPAGRKVAAHNRADGRRPLALALVRAGLLHDQARRFLDTFPPNQQGDIACRMANARRAAPQLVSLLQLWPNVRVGAELHVPASLVDELTAVWALLAPPSDERAEEDKRRKSIGNRAEAYSYQLERLATTNPGDIVWVAQDDDRLGYDIEDRGSDPRRRIEVKGSGGTETRFFMSDNEWREAHDDPQNYEVHFWGGIDLNRPVADEYPFLRTRGFPVVLRSLPTLRSSALLVATPDRWRIEAVRATEQVQGE